LILASFWTKWQKKKSLAQTDAAQAEAAAQLQPAKFSSCRPQDPESQHIKMYIFALHECQVGSQTKSKPSTAEEPLPFSLHFHQRIWATTKLLHEGELMKNQKQAQLFSLSGSFQAIQTSAGYAVFFFTRSDCAFYPAREAPDTPTGWTRQGLSSYIVSAHGSDSIVIK
jgi:hypothetical protein